jgi:hypothetical protein
MGKKEHGKPLPDLTHHAENVNESHHEEFIHPNAEEE